MDASTPHGHLSVQVEGAHPPEVRFSFGQQPTRSAWSFLASAGFDVALVLLFVLLGRIPHKAPAPVPHDLHDEIVWLDQKGPSGGGGGGGQQAPPVLPPKPVDPVVPVVQAAPVVAPTVIQPEQVDVVDLTAALIDLPGTTAAPGSLGIGGGAGTGSGGGFGSGTGSGVGPGSGGGTGGGVYQAGNGVTSPVPISVPKPKYTAEAMKAKLQGIARVRCVVQPNGICTDIAIEHSLDATMGLDQEAINSVKLWRFKPGMRLGQAVPVQVMIDVEFALR